MYVMHLHCVNNPFLFLKAINPPNFRKYHANLDGIHVYVNLFKLISIQFNSNIKRMKYKIMYKFYKWIYCWENILISMIS